ncbi:MAG: hypothetical protein LIO90_05120 [Bacteroidales bacterium]|nr:hypothetical protein [Bacteroidales bacterium]
MSTTQHSLQPLFVAITSQVEPLASQAVNGEITPTALRHAMTEMDFTTAYDLIRAITRRLVEEERVEEAIQEIKDFDALVERRGEEDGRLLDFHAALMQILTSLYRHLGQTDDALHTAAAALTLLSQNPKRKDEPFLSTLAPLLYDIALLHYDHGEYKQAERELEKAVKLFERLARTHPERYGAAHLLAMNATTQVYRSRVKQVNTLAHYQVASNTYLEMLNQGVEKAANSLVESLTNEGDTLMKMGRQREAVQYYLRALKYLTRLEPEFTLRQLHLSISLGEALLSVKASREKGVHLLNTMLHKATKLGANDDHRRIVEILSNTKNGGLDILGFWHKIFPR